MAVTWSHALIEQAIHATETSNTMSDYCSGPAGISLFVSASLIPVGHALAG
jgi:hypothetical protein